MPNDNHYDSGEDDMEDKPKSEDKEDSSDGNTALLSKSFFRDKENIKPGAIEKVKILELMDDEVLVECVYGDKKEKDAESNSNDDRSGPMKESEAAMDEAMA